MSPDSNGWDWLTGGIRLVNLWVLATVAVGGALVVVLVAIAVVGWDRG